MTAVRTARSDVEAEHGQARRAGVLLVVGDGEEPRPQQPSVTTSTTSGEAGEHDEVAAWSSW